MLSSIVKFSKSLSVKILVGIIILPFVFWGMGDIFSGGSQNIIAKIDSEKVSTKEFAEYLNRLNLNDKEVKDLKKTDLVQKILSEYIGRRIIKLEMEELGIVFSDSSLKNIIVNYVGAKHSPENNEVTLLMVIETFAEEFGELVVPSSNNNSSLSSCRILLSIERCLGRVLKTVSAVRVLKSAGQLCS